MRDRILHRLASRLPHTDVDAVIESFQRSPQLQGDLGWLVDILDAADILALPMVPTDVSARLIGLWPDDQPRRLETATLIHDSRSAGELVGVRGMHRSSGWTSLFTAVSADIAIDGEPQDTGATIVGGQILGRSSGASAYVVTVSGPIVATTTSDAVGQFDLGQLPDGRYEFEATAVDHILSAILDVGPSCQ